jgi:hypothetical protein
MVYIEVVTLYKSSIKPQARDIIIVKNSLTTIVLNGHLQINTHWR